MKRLFLALLLLASSLSLSAQTRELREGEDQTKVLYKYPGFVAGQVILNNGTRTQGLLNYNLYTKTIQFKNDNGTVMDIADPSQVAYVDMVDRRFVWRGNNWFEILGDFGDMSIACISYLTPKNEARSSGDYGGQSIASGSHRVRNYDAATGQFVLSTNQLFVFEEHFEYYVVRKNKFYRTNTIKSLEKPFSKSKAEVRAYVNANNLDTNNLDDLKTLLNHAVAEGW
ncbi:MAG: hypothetical protein IJ979_04145 [Tidjanibacter sp.]|nr:hypothetical protein [Tidjanibacter sp.]MBR4064509.1 hypothetical protein [Tidjanibacter sp.]